jgi:hypothetical protein
MKSAQASSQKYVNRAGAASGDYVSGAEQTSRDQAAAAIAAEPVYKQAVVEAANRGAYSAGLRKSGKAGWLNGVQKKGATRFAEGVAAGADKYAVNSGKFDSARSAADSLPRGLKGSEANFQRSKVVGQALRTLKVGGSK